MEGESSKTINLTIIRLQKRIPPIVIIGLTIHSTKERLGGGVHPANPILLSGLTEDINNDKIV